MKHTFSDTVAWVKHHPAGGLDLIRIFLGIALLIRGVLFVQQPELVLSYIESSGDWFWPMAITHYVGLAHLGGGVLLLLGLFTRTGALIQLPALFGAVFFVHLGEGLFGAGESLELAIMVLTLLCVFAVFGSGPLSVDAIMARPKDPTTKHPKRVAKAAAP